ncbi:ADP,ATP carrier protein 1 [Candidatus Protochlamydia naegleriophila]|uniref:ADP,ATP carrier protein n=1 Tax=Candidatus Protochlamydia naegleriophila TaxID=389348 RepID=A0A0U5EPK0_9BACT|nr:NTP/NDP exchange transporter [Candidatus Protochlamydia naegleriophila]CUI15907.1 ADP,ATP carrier protein 1 [Candidatus Protochlamydia naegleriophila]
MSQDAKQDFGKWRSFFWPVHGYELKKLLPMFFMFFCISFNYTILRDTKDSLIVTAAGAEAIPFLKSFGVVPAAILFMIVYAKLSNMLSRENLFYVTLLPFIIFFGLFAFVMYPAREALMPQASAEALRAYLPGGWSGLAAAYENWMYSIFYILAELWGSVVLSLLFWGFANQITRVTEAKRFYSLFGLGANLALLVSGPAIVYVSDIRKHLPANVDAWQISLNYLMGMVVIAGIAILAIYWWINRNVLTDPRFYDANQTTTKKKKAKMSLGDSFKFLFTSKYILCLAILVIAYGISINLVEITWKNQVKLQYPNPNDYSTFMGWFSTMTGAVTILMMLFVGGNVIRRKGWGFAALITPVVLLVTGIGFFSFVIFRDSLLGYIAAIGSTPLFLAVMFGAAQNIMSKSAKYSLFDPTKEMAYIPLDEDSKVKGKAAVDVVGARLGKSGGSIIQMTLLAFGTLATITPYIGAILMVIIAIWIVAARSLSKQFAKLTAEQNQPTDKSDKTSEATAS